MYLHDLSPRSYMGQDRFPVGWLSREFPFPKGPTSALFRERLQELCWLPIGLTCGVHECEFCSGQPTVGNGEIHVRASDGKIYFAPEMVIHYVEAHEYRPPDVFIEAVESLPKYEWAIPVPELSNRVRAASENPTPENWDAFAATFLESRVGVAAFLLREPPAARRQPNDLLETKSGQKILLCKFGFVGDFKSQSESHLGFSVLADFENCHGQEWSDHVGLEVRDLVGPAAAMGLMIHIQASPPGPPSSLSISPSGVARLAELQTPA
jgi:hypothetical protein